MKTKSPLTTKEKFRDWLYLHLTLFRDNSWVPGWLVEVVDYIRYEWLWDNDKDSFYD